MSSQVSSSIQNRSPYVVTVRTDVTLNRRFSAGQKKRAQTYVTTLAARGIKASLVQLETSFQLRVRRKGVPAQYITFDTLASAEQARLQIDAQLSVSIVRDYAVATKTTLCDLLERYVDEVVPSHKGADVERARIGRLLRDEAFVDKKLAALSTEDLQDPNRGVKRSSLAERHLVTSALFMSSHCRHPLSRYVGCFRQGQGYPPIEVVGNYPIGALIDNHPPK